jgi:hypothetical protein
MTPFGKPRTSFPCDPNVIEIFFNEFTLASVTDGVKLRERAVEQHLDALGAGKTSLMISPRHEEGRRVAAVVRQKLKAEGAIGAEDHAITVLRRMDLGSEARRDLLHYAPGRVVAFHSRTAGGFRPGEKWTVKETNCETVTLESNGKVRQFNHLLRVSGTYSFPQRCRSA